MEFLRKFAFFSWKSRPVFFFSQEVLAISTATSQRVSMSFKRPLDQKIVKSIEVEQTSHEDFISRYEYLYDQCVCTSAGLIDKYCVPYIYLQCMINN